MMLKKLILKQKNQFIRYKYLIYGILAVSLAILISGATILFKDFQNTPPRLEYRISIADPNMQTLAVRLMVRGVEPGRDFILYKGELEPSDLSGRDDSGVILAVHEDAEVLKIKARRTKTIILNYVIRVGFPGKHGLRGFINSDLITFSGEQVFLLPYNVVSNPEVPVKRNLSGIKIQVEVCNGWKAVMPITAGNGGNTAAIQEPTWSKIYNMLKSCYAFGRFKEVSHSNSRGKLKIYMHSLSGSDKQASLQGIGALYDYFTDLFGTAPPVLSVVLFPKEQGPNSYIMGGAGVQTIGATFDSENPRDWQLLAHRLFHAFFDSRVTTPAYHTPPRLWFNEGLATYYENAAMESLSPGLRNRLRLGMEDGFSQLFKRYLYFRIKDQSLLALAPMNEARIQGSGGRIEFLHYTQAPLVIKIMEDFSFTKHHKPNRILRFILSGADRNIGIPEIVKHVMGNEARSFSQLFLENPGILPAWYLNRQDEQASSVIRQLNHFEYTLWTWFRLEYPSYPLDYIKDDLTSIRQLPNLTATAELQKIFFGSKKLENKVKSASPLIYQLLKEYTLRANICQVSFNDPLLRFKLGSPEKLSKWEVYRKLITP